MNVTKFVVAKLFATYLNLNITPSISNESLISEQQPTSPDASDQHSTVTANRSTLAPTLETTFQTFPPVGPLTSYIMVTPVGINQVKYLTAYEQEVLYAIPLAITREFTYLDVKADDLTAKKLIGTKFISSHLSSLKEITFNKQNYCHSKIDGYIVISIGAFKDRTMIEGATAVGTTEFTTGNQQFMFPIKGIIAPAQNSDNKLYIMPNPGFYGSEFFVYSYDGNIGEFTEQSTLESFDVVKAFAEVLKIFKIRNSAKPRIFYAGDLSDPLVAHLISSVNKTVPVFLTLEDTLKNIMHEFFHQGSPEVELNEFGCPKGVQTKQETIDLKPFSCTQKFPIRGLTDSIKDYGMQFTLEKTNRWFSLNIETEGVNSSKSTFSIRFTKKGIIIKGDEDVVSSAGINNPSENQNNIESTHSTVFEFKGLIDSKPYTIRLKAEEFQFGLSADASAQIDIRKQGDSSFKHIGIFNIYSQPKTVQFCGFSPGNHISRVKKVSTRIINFQSQFINQPLRNGTTLPHRRLLKSPS